MKIKLWIPPSKSNCVIWEIAKTTISQIAKVAKIAKKIFNIIIFDIIIFNIIIFATFAIGTFLRIKFCCVAIATGTQKTQLCYLQNCVFFAIAISQLSHSILQPWFIALISKFNTNGSPPKNHDIKTPLVVSFSLRVVIHFCHVYL